MLCCVRTPVERLYMHVEIVIARLTWDFGYNKFYAVKEHFKSVLVNICY